MRSLSDGAEIESGDAIGNLSFAGVADSAGEIGLTADIRDVREGVGLDVFRVQREV